MWRCVGQYDRDLSTDVRPTGNGAGAYQCQRRAGQQQAHAPGIRSHSVGPERHDRLLANLQIEPMRQTVFAIMSLRRAAHLKR